MTGGTGLLGAAVIPALRDAGWSVRVFSRSASAESEETFVGDMRNAEDIHRAMQGCTHVIHLAAAKNDEPESEAVQMGGMQHLIDAAKAHGIRRIINVSTQSARLPRRGIYGETKKRADDLLAASGLEHVTLRFSVIYGDTPEGIVGSIMRMARLPLVPMIGKGNAVLRPLHRSAAARIILAALTAKGVEGMILDAGGERAMTLLELTQDILRMQGRRRYIVSIPETLALAIARINAACGMHILTRSNVLGAIQPMPMNLEPLHRMLGGINTGGWPDNAPVPTPQHSSAQADARILLCYVIPGFTPSTDDIDRLQSALESHALTLPPSRLLHSALKLSIADTATRLRRPNGYLQQVLLIVAAVAETSPASAEILLPQSRHPATVWWMLFMASIRSACILLVSIPWIVMPSLLDRHDENL